MEKKIDPIKILRISLIIAGAALKAYYIWKGQHVDGYMGSPPRRRL